MAIDSRAANRYIVVQEVDDLSPKELQKSILRQEAVGDDFSLMSVPMLAKHDTLFKVVRREDELVFAICLLDLGEKALPANTSVELFFDTRHDHLGWIQFCFSPRDGMQCHHHQPYPEAAATSFRYPGVRSWQWLDPGQGGHAGVYGSAFPGWLFVHLAVDDIFQNRRMCGFNVGRIHPKPYEASSWNLASGIGFQDASSFGHLYLELPDCALSDDIEGWCQNEQLFVHGECSGDAAGLSFDLIDPLGETRPVDTELGEDSWRAQAWLNSTIRGRYRLVPKLPDNKTIEPEWLEIDLFQDEAEPRCIPGMTYDIPDNVLMGPAPYTAKALAAEFDLLLYHGLTRLHWLDYPPEHPVWWRQNDRLQQHLIDGTFESCNDLLHVAIQLAHQRGMTFTGIFKPFDIATNYSPHKGHVLADHLTTIQEQEGTEVLVPKSWKHRPTCHAQSHPDWRFDPALPITRLRLWSREPLPDLESDDIVLWVSDDNQSYEPYNGPVTMRQGEEDRPNLKWSPAGNQPITGTTRNWTFTLDDLTLDAPYVAIEIRHPELRFTHRAHALLEAWDAGHESFTPLPANAGDLDEGFSFWKEWPSWRNRTPRLWEELTWGQGVHGATFQWLRRLPTLLDPADEGVRQYWLRNVKRVLAAGADSVSIRTLCHHNSTADYLRYAFHRQTLQAFEDAFGREATTDDDDLTHLRLIRGRAYTQFIREASQLARQVDRRFAIHLEYGMEVPPDLHQRMQIHFDWETWIEEGLIDEIILKWWFPRNRFIQERVLPLARKHGISVVVTERNHSIHPNQQAPDYVRQLLGDIRDAGCDGFVFYEMANYVLRNQQNVPRCQDDVFDALCRAFPAAHLT